jgi:uncharacterized membrane protein
MKIDKNELLKILINHKKDYVEYYKDIKKPNILRLYKGYLKGLDYAIETIKELEEKE